METKQEHVKKELSLGLWEKYLTVWIAICIVVGLLVGQLYSCVWAVYGFIKVCTVIHTDWHIAFLHDVSNSVGIQFSDVKKAVKNPKPLIVTIIANWLIAPPLMTFLGKHLLPWKPTIHCRSNPSGLVTLYSDGYVVDVPCPRRHGTRTH